MGEIIQRGRYASMKELACENRIEHRIVSFQETVEYGEKCQTSDSEVFSNVYHKLVHSGAALQTMLQVEQSYALAVSHLMNQRNEQIAALTNRYAFHTILRRYVV